MPDSSSHGFDFAGQRMVALPGRALFWPVEAALVVADMHLEKASWLAATGQMLPPYDSADTVRRLAALVEQTGARRIYALGDSFHDGGGAVRLDAATRDALTALARQAQLVWVEGNHDAALVAPPGFPGEWPGVLDVRGIRLCHESDADFDGPELSGHFHPKVRVAGAARAVSRPCFLLAGSRLILPAFGTLTGGIDVGDPVFNRFGPAQAMVATARGLHHFPVARRANCGIKAAHSRKKA